MIVAVVIGVLLSFITAAAFSALTRGQEFAIQTEVGKLALAMEAFKQQYGSYPPANLTPPSSTGKKDRLYSFVARAFPRYIERLATDPDLEGSIQQRVRNDLQGTQDGPGNGGKGIFLGDTPDEFNPAHALMFWLVGFSNDPADPFAGHRERMKGDDLACAFYDFNPDNIGHAFYDLASESGLLILQSKIAMPHSLPFTFPINRPVDCGRTRLIRRPCFILTIPAMQVAVRRPMKNFRPTRLPMAERSSHAVFK